MSDHLLIYCTCPDQDSAQSIADTLVDKGLAACVNILPGVHSVYRWQGKRENAREYLLTIKTLHSAYEALQQAIIDLHPYELPEIIAVPITHGLAAYLAWIDENVTNENQ